MKKVINTIINVKDFFYLILDDILLVIGLSLVTKGTFLFSSPAGYIMAGLCLLFVAFIVAKRR